MRKKTQKSSDHLGHCENNLDREMIINWTGEVSVEVVWNDFYCWYISRVERLHSARTYPCPSSGVSPPRPCLSLPLAGPRRLIHTGCIISDFPLGLAHERFLQKIRGWLSMRSVRLGFSQLPPCHQGGCCECPLRPHLDGYPVWFSKPVPVTFFTPGK